MSQQPNPQKRQNEGQQSQNQPLDPEALKVARHWVTYRPRMSQELQKQGRFNQSVQSLTDLMRDSQADLVGRGMDYQAALEQSRPIAYLPSEEDVPDLPNNPLLRLPETTE